MAGPRKPGLTIRPGRSENYASWLSPPTDRACGASDAALSALPNRWSSRSSLP
jgi:hypothetical protein